jgi:hypothetical protein
MSIIFRGGSQDITIPQGLKIGISCVNGTGVIYYSTSPYSPYLFYEHTRVSQSTITLGTFDSDQIVRLVALTDDVIYDVAVTPSLGLQDLTSSEISQLSNIGTTTISADQWGYVGEANQSLKTTDTPSFNGMVSTGDIYNVAWVDYSGSSSINGWSSTSVSIIRYKTVGKLVFVSFYINGTSDSTDVNFTLPLTTSNTGLTFGGAMETAYDNGVNLTTATRVKMDPNSQIVACYKDMAQEAWTASGIKIVRGSLWFESE